MSEKNTPEQGSNNGPDPDANLDNLFGEEERANPRISKNAQRAAENTPESPQPGAAKPGQEPNGSRAPQLGEGADGAKSAGAAAGAAGADGRSRLSQSKSAGAMNAAQKGAGDYQRRKAQGQSKGEAAAGAATGEAAKQVADKYSGGLVTAASQTKIGAKIVNKAQEMAGDQGAKQYKYARRVVVAGSAALVLIILATVGTLVVILGTEQEEPLADTCLAEYYGDGSEYEVQGLAKNQERTVRDILRATSDLNHPANSAALAAYVAFAENGLSPKSDLNRKYVGAFQQDTSWQMTWVENNEPMGEAVFGTAKDPRLDPYRSARAYLNALKTRLKSNGVKGTPHESTQAVEAALNQLGVDTGGYSSWWKAWKAADLSESFTNPDNAGAVATLGNWVQGFQPEGGAGAGNTAGSSNYVRKAVSGASYWEPILQANARERDAGYEYLVNTMANRNAAEAAAKVSAGLSADAPVELEITGYANDEDRLPGTYVLGDSLSVSLKDELEEQGVFVDAVEGRPLDSQILEAALRSPDAQTRGTWVIQLGTNNSANEATIAGIEQKVNKIRKLRNPQAPQTVYWVTPYRPDDYPNLGSAKPFADEVRRVALGENWLRVLDFENLVATSENSGKWFAQDGIHLVGKGQEAMTDLIMGVSGASDPVSATSLFDGCVSGGISNEYLPTGEALWFKGERGKFKVDGPQTEDAPYWLPGNLERANKAMRKPPCDDGRCSSLCAQLAARVSGQSNSGSNNARSLWFAMKARGVEGQDWVANNGNDKGRAYSPPPGAMLFWNIGEHGHVATYVGDGDVVHNYDYDGDGRQEVVRMPAHEVNERYGQGGPKYYGWSLPPNAWKEYPSKEAAQAAKDARKAARASGRSLYFR